MTRNENTFLIFSGTSETNEYSISMKSIGNLGEFYTFGIYGRDFSLDSTDSTDGAGILRMSSILIVLLAGIVTFSNMS